ncbi:MAG: hypothetical protein ACP5N7_03875 [Candidatus Pacearchaeota archaeon]
MSEVSGEYLPTLRAIHFSHLLPKGSYKHYKLNPDNIMLKTEQEHIDWHSCSRADLVKKDSRWQKVLDKYELLKSKYIEEFGG